MAPSNDICYYGLHFGCLNAIQDAGCRRCAERLTHAVENVLHPTRVNAMHTTRRAENAQVTR